MASSPEFHDALQSSKFPIVILFIGASRVGKSTRLNQILFGGKAQGGLKHYGPFSAGGGSSPVTFGFHFCGPISCTELKSIHGLECEIPPNREADIFLIDCEGTGSLHGATQTFAKGLFALCQISTINVIVHGSTINQPDIAELATFFKMSKVIKSSSQQVETGFAVIERDVGLPYSTSGPPQDGSVAFEDARHRQDANRYFSVPCGNWCSLF
jgi:hypothetical protein